MTLSVPYIQVPVPNRGTRSNQHDFHFSISLSPSYLSISKSIVKATTSTARSVLSIPMVPLYSCTYIDSIAQAGTAGTHFSVALLCVKHYFFFTFFSLTLREDRIHIPTTRFEKVLRYISYIYFTVRNLRKGLFRQSKVLNNF
jgi:hypothetical protein